ncbi:MAG TPA: phosphatase PAP2 family protein [Thermoanaerobaculia bacterium]|jgi:membrane-associated phospholipid phosphatase|nr:phosphatase PAP2 family protein [Thermoanaerobaculia bacterium]
MAAPREPLLAWPGVESLKLTLPLSYLFSKIFFSIYGGTSLLAGLRRVRPDFHFAWELRLPFIPWLAIVYLSVPLLLLLTPFILRTWRSFTPFFLALTAETLVAGVIFLILPMAQVYPARVAYGLGGAIFHLADRLNLQYNEFPSLHVAFTVTAAIVFGRRRGPLGRALFAVWAVGVAVSTLFMHEHHLLDLASGAVLGLVGVATVWRRTSRDEVLEALRIESLCLREFAWFVRRHPRYLTMFFALFRASVPRWRKTRVLRATYCLAQHVDDVLDGDRKIKGDPEAYVLAVVRGLRGETPFGETTAEQLAAFVAGELSRFESEQSDLRISRDHPRSDLVKLFEVLIEDRRRMDARRTLSAEALAEQHRLTFFYSLNLTLILAGSGLRAGDAPDLVAALAWCLPVRSLDLDLEKGLINVPAEVLARAGWNGDPAILATALDTAAVQDWLRGEHRRAAAAIQSLGNRLNDVAEPRGRAILSRLHLALAVYEKKYRRRHPFDEPGSQTRRAEPLPEASKG